MADYFETKRSYIPSTKRNTGWVEGWREEVKFLSRFSSIFSLPDKRSSPLVAMEKYNETVSRRR